MAVETTPRAEVFDLRTPYLVQGITSEYRAQTELLSVLIKVYAEGGENLMHAHPREDHSFIVLEGEATFYLGSEDNVRVLHQYEGVMLPRGTYYRFQSTCDRNLVMLRVGAQTPGALKGAIYPDGQGKSRAVEPMGRLPRIERPGPGFGA